MSAAGVIARLNADLGWEQDALHPVLAELSEEDWALPTPAPGWTIRDQVAHLAHFDVITRVAIGEPERFLTLREDIADLQAYVDQVGPTNLHRSGPELLRWWSEESVRLRAVSAEADPAVRVPWFGPSMSLASKITARIMETWAHGQDIRDGLGITVIPANGLRHIARIGVLTFAHSFAVRDLDAPDRPMRIELEAPDGSQWTQGPADSEQSVTGSMLDFCLVVTQRRHVRDTRLQVRGSTAAAWMDIAQAFAGPPGRGRHPGQFGTRTTPSAPTEGNAP